MLSKKMYTAEYIQVLHDKTRNDPLLLERVVLAFGLLEAIARVGLPFCFKGGTALLLLLDHPRRLSTDIDIVVEPGTDIDGFIRKAGEIFPFKSVEENIRPGKNNIVKRHFRFTCFSPRTGNDITILLDVLIESIKYSNVIERPISNELLLSEGNDLTVKIPDVNGILGEKLTAFAPCTTGIPFGVSKELEIIKQLFDCGMLFDAVNNFNDVCVSYYKIVNSEIAYRGLDITPVEVLKDTIIGCLSIASRGQYYQKDYEYYKDGILRIRNHIISGKFNGEIAGAYACRIMYLAASILCGNKNFNRIEDYGSHLDSVGIPKAKVFSYLKFVDSRAYKYICEAVRLLQNLNMLDIFQYN